jgi:hypothetical protein
MCPLEGHPGDMIQVFACFGKGRFAKRSSGIEKPYITMRRGFTVEITDHKSRCFH